MNSVLLRSSHGKSETDKEGHMMTKAELEFGDFKPKNMKTASQSFEARKRTGSTSFQFSQGTPAAYRLILNF